MPMSSFWMLPLTPGERLQIMGRADGAVTQFESPLLRLENAPGGTVLVVGFPRTVSHTERRGAHRVPIPHTLNLPPPVLAGATGAFEGRLLDVSEGGFGALAMTAQLPQIGSLLACTMSLPGAKLLADARICSALREDGAGRLGLRFTALSASQIDALRRAVARLDRQALRQASAVLG
jgi:c-di-GMP-binding flagellar brake protein YcgR